MSPRPRSGRGRAGGAGEPSLASGRGEKNASRRGDSQAGEETSGQPFFGGGSGSESFFCCSDFSY
jgi:hypothetical protein